MNKIPALRRVATGFGTSLLLLCQACATGTSAPLAPAGDSAAALHPRILALVGDAPCDRDAECRSIGIGHKACGGPAGYLAWSTRNVRQPELEALVRRHAQAQQAEDERAGLLSDCRLVTDPGAVCEAKRCRLRASGGGSMPSAR